MSIKSTKKFLKQNNLLQRDLLAFLSWRESQNGDSFDQNKTLNKKEKNNASNFSIFIRKTSPLKKKKILKKFYRPRETQIFDLSLERDQKRTIFGQFFPHKKPFLSFWVFPLLGGCFLSLLTLSQSETVKNKKFGFPNLDRQSQLSSFYEKKALENEFLTEKFSPVLPKNSYIDDNLHEKLTYVNFYKQTTDRNYLKLGLSSDLENLCRFYLGLTSRNSQAHDQSDWLLDPDLVGILDKMIEKNPSLKNDLTFDVVWHSLHTDQGQSLKNGRNQNFLILKSTQNFNPNKIRMFLEESSFEDFPAKIKNENFHSQSQSKEIFSFLQLSNVQNLKVPHISYIEASKFLDRWITQLTEIKSKRNHEANSHHFFQKNLNIQYQQTNLDLHSPNILDTINVLNNLTTNKLDLTKKTSLTDYVFEFFDSLQKNQKLLKNSSSIFDFDSATTSSVQYNNTIPYRSELTAFSMKNLNSSKFFLQRIQSYYKYSFLKKFLTKCLFNKNKGVRTIQRSNENLLDFSPKISLLPERKNSKNSNNQRNEDRTILVLKNSHFKLDWNRTNKKKTLDFKEQNVENMEHLFKYSVFLKFVQKKSLLENKTEKILRNIQSLNSTNFSKSSNLKSVRMDLQKLSYELMLLNSWKKLLSNFFELNSTQTLSNVRFDSKRKDQNFLDFQNSLFSLESEPNKKLKQAYVDGFNKNLFKEVHLYKRLNRISKCLLETVFSTQKNNIGKTMQAEDPFFRTQKIFKYKTPILSGNVSSANKSVLDLALNSNNLAEFKIKPQKFQTSSEKKSMRNPIFWYELAAKQSDLKNLSTFPQKEFFRPKNFSLFFSKLSKIIKEVNFESPVDTEAKKILKFSKTFDQHQFNNYLGKLELKKIQPESFSVFKELTDSKDKTMFLLNISNSKNLSSSKNRLNYFRRKLPANSKISISRFKKRKAEKLFRAYLSTKYSSNREKKTRRWSSILPVLKNFKKTLKYKKKNEVVLTSKESKLWKISSVANSTPDSKKIQRKSWFLTNVSPNFVFEKNNQLETGAKYLAKQTSAKSEQFLRKLFGYTHFLKKNECELKETQIKRLEKKHVLQKKRRLKKLKLENRRRKKRKRFYPRPNSLRFELYNSFLQKRHSQKSEKNVENDRNINFFARKQPTTLFKKEFQKKIFQQKSDSDLLKQQIFRQKKQKWGNLDAHLFFAEKEQLTKLAFDWMMPTYHQKEYYKISNETLTDFERLCWKSYWLRSNLTPYVRRVQENWKRMKEIETLKNSSTTFSALLKDLILYPLPPKKNFPFSQNSSRFCLEQANLQSGSYLNIKDTLNWSKIPNPKSSSFKALENKAEYDRLLHERITEEIKNVKAQLNIDGQKQARSYKLGRQKLDQQKGKNSSYSLIFSGLRFLDPKVHALEKPLGSVHSSIKPFGDLPTLRLLWACNKTNLWTFKETNFSRQLWSSYKNREQIKNNKTKKFLKKVFRLSGWNQKNVDTMSFNKGDQNCRKIQAFGGHVFEKNSRSHLRSLKLKFQNRNFLNFEPYPSQNREKRDERNKSLTKGFETKLPFVDTKEVWFERALEFKSQKRRTHFWWSTQQNNPIETILDFWFLSPKSSLSLKDFVQTNKNIFVKTNHQFTDDYVNNTMLGSGFWICCLILHISIFFALARIPEIRSLFKFQFLLISKLVNSYLICLFTLYDLLIDYKKRVDFSIQNFKKFSQKMKFDQNSNNSIKNKNFEFEQSFLFFKKNSFRFRNSIPFKRSSELLKSSNYIDSQKTPDDFSFSFRLNPKRFLSSRTGQYLRWEKDSTLNQKSVRLTSSGLSQSTISYRVLVRNFLDFSARIQESSNTYLPLNSILSYSVAPSFGSVYSGQKSSNSVSADPKNSFYAWSTGYLWNLSSKSKSQRENSQKPNDQTFSFAQKKSVFFEELKDSQILTEIPEVFDRKKLIKNKKLKFSRLVESNIQLQSILALLTLYITQSGLNMFYYCFSLFYKVVFKTIDIMESILLIFYKFFEKPAEVVVEWIADIFLVEWSSDVTSYIPEALDTALWESTTKFSRSMRISNGPLSGFFVNKIFLSCIENFYSWLLRPEADLMVRQKKGIVFWDIWAEILIQAAEQYKMNISSLSTIKEEQELLIENILEDNEPESKTKNSSLTRKKANKISSTNFLNSAILNASLMKMRPLTRILHYYPGEFLKKTISFVESDSIEALNNPYKFYDRKIKLLNSFFIERSDTQNLDFFQKTNLVSSWKRWSVNQFLNTQGRDTDLFMDLHPAKSFSNVKFLKSYTLAQEILGSVVCDVYSGLFNKKISKNILIVGAAGTAKTVFVQALAGETELKIVTENANRYSIIQGGIPIGMKLLRDVFDSIAMHTPCLFLLEDIHVIGERRPMLISDDENSKANDTSFGAEQEEVHEKNKLIYQSSRHSISHYKKPYKGDFSLSKPTNYFCYDFFLGTSSARKRMGYLTTRSPLSVLQLENLIEAKDSANVKMEHSRSNAFLSVLEISTEQIFAPPATSPFTILLMKEQKKLKPKKLVKQLPWSGISYDQSMLISKSNYAVRSKVALLAEIAMNNLSIKLDMITDLLVIIDSVRSNRGFVVFATTHLPSLLDPALRRPGRLDETLSLPFLPNLSSRFEVLKTSLASCRKNLDLFDYSLFAGKLKQDENFVSSTISKSLLLLLNSKGSKKAIVSNSLRTIINGSGQNFLCDFPIYSISQALRSTLQFDFVVFDPRKNKRSSNAILNEMTENQKNFLGSKIGRNESSNLFLFLNSNKLNLSFSGHDRLNFVAYTYGQAGQFLAESLILKDQTTYTRKIFKSNLISGESSPDEQILKILYSSKIQANVLMLKLFAGKFAEFFALNNDFFNSFNRFQGSMNSVPDPITENLISLNNSAFANFEKKIPKHLKQHTYKKQGWWLGKNSSLQVNPAQSSLSDNVQNFQNYWQSATSFIESLIQKRFLNTKNSIVSKLLLFEDRMSLREPLSPPNSSILTPARKFESYKRTLRDFIQRPMLTINEKLQMHQKQRFLKLLYKVPIQTSFKTISKKSFLSKDTLNINKTTTDFYNSFKELSYLDVLTLKPTSSFYYYKSDLITRHRFSFLNQWWNGQLAEHNVETTYLSHVDWRSMFIESLGDVSLDFPDAEQFYNPQSRRWFLQSKSWEYWQSFEKISRTTLAQHCIFSCFTSISAHLNTNREFFDYLGFRFLRYHNVQEIDLVNFSVRFYKTQQMLIS